MLRQIRIEALGDRHGQLGGRLWHGGAFGLLQYCLRREYALDFQAPEIAVFVRWRGWQPTAAIPGRGGGPIRDGELGGRPWHERRDRAAEVGTSSFLPRNGPGRFRWTRDAN